MCVHPYTYTAPFFCLFLLSVAVPPAPPAHTQVRCRKRASSQAPSRASDTSCIGGNGNPLQCSCLENPTDRGAWWAVVHGVAKSRTRLSDFTFTFHFHALEKEIQPSHPLSSPSPPAPNPSGKESAFSVGDLFSIPGLGRSPGEGKGSPFQYSWGFPGGSDGASQASAQWA